MNRMLRCPQCRSYALSETCTCGGVRVPVLPPKYSPEDRYASYRRRYKEQLKKA